MKKLASFLYFFVCSMLLFSLTAQAYIDPSAMTYIIQLVAGVAIAAGAGLSFYFRRLKRKLSGKKSADSAAAAPQAPQDDDDFGLGDYDLDADDADAGEQ